MPAAATRLHKLIEASGIPITGVSLGVNGVYRIDFNGASDQQIAHAAEILAAFDGLDTPDPDPQGFVKTMAAQPNTELLLVALRLSFFLDDATRKTKYLDHASLSPIGKALLEDAASAAGMPLK